MEVADVGLGRERVLGRSADVVVVKVNCVFDHGAEDRVAAVVVSSDTGVVLSDKAVAFEEVRAAVLFVAFVEGFGAGLVDELLVLVVEPVVNVSLVLDDYIQRRKTIVSGVH